LFELLSSSVGNGNYYVADTNNNKIRVITTSNNLVVTIVGTGTAGLTGDNGAATSALLNLPRAIVGDGNGNLWIADTANHRIRLVDSNSIITNYAGTGSAGGTVSNFAVATSTGLSYPGNLLYYNGQLYISNTGQNQILIAGYFSPTGQPSRSPTGQPSTQPTSPTSKFGKTTFFKLLKFISNVIFVLYFICLFV
jgi:hypothetical protein